MDITNSFEKMAEAGSRTDICELVGNLVYYIIMIIVFLIALEVLGISAVLEPLEHMVALFLGFLPNLVAAIIIGFVGYALAKFVSTLVGLAGEFISRMAAKAGIDNTEKLLISFKKWYLSSFSYRF